MIAEAVVEAVVEANKQSSVQKELATDFISKSQFEDQLPKLRKENSNESENGDSQGSLDLA